MTLACNPYRPQRRPQQEQYAYRSIKTRELDIQLQTRTGYHFAEITFEMLFGKVSISGKNTSVTNSGAPCKVNTERRAHNLAGAIPKFSTARLYKT